MGEAAAASKRRAIIDTDMGTDDAVAILMCLRPQSTLALEALTTCFGNVSEDQSSFNAMVVLEHAKALGTVPIYRGAKHPMVQGVVGGREGDGPEWSGHGADGLGGVGLGDRTKCPDVEVGAAFEREHAAVALTRMASQDPGQLTVIAIGPLTNVALACTLDPEFAGNCRELIIMGGCSQSRGNASPSAEFNFFMDPEAAHIVLHAFSPKDANTHPKVTLVPWEACLDASIPWLTFDTLTAASSNSNAAFLKQICTAYEAAERKAKDEAEASPTVEGGFISGFCPCDGYALTVADLGKPAVKRARNLFCTVELSGSVSRGACAYDWRGALPGRHPNVRLVQDVELDSVVRVLRETFC